MRVNLQQNNNNNKISITRMISFPPMVPYNERPMPVLASHITFLPESDSSSTWNMEQTIEQKPRIRKKKIFQHKQVDKAVQVEPDLCNHQAKQEEKQLRKVKSNASIEPKKPKEKVNINGRINQINQLLQQHRQQRVAHFGQPSVRQSNQNKETLIKITQRLSESAFLMKKQEQVLTTKIPTFQKKIADNQTAIVEMSNLIKSKIEQDNRNMENIVNLVSKSQSRMKIKQNELNQINTKLLQKESQLNQNKQLNRKKELELIRIKRIEDLQNKNLELYQQIQKKNAVSHFQNYVADENEARQGWEDEEEPHKFSYNQQSTIRYADCPFNTSGNNTIGDILSPLALNEHNYLA